MFHEVIVKFRVNHQRNKEDAKIVAEKVMEQIQEYENSAIVFIEKPSLLKIKEVGIDCHTCNSCWSDEVIVGDRGNGIETVVKYYCPVKSKEIKPSKIDFCDYYIKKEKIY